VSTIGYSTLSVIPEVKNLRSQLEAQTSRDFAAAGKRGGQQFGDAAGKEASGRLKSHFAGIGKEVFAPLAGLAAGAGIVELFKGSIGAASDLAESGSKINVVFGDAAGQVEKFASQGADKLGTTKLAALDAAASFGVFGKAAGLQGPALAGFSDKLVGLSRDMASFFNTSPEQAIEAIGAGLRGESEPLRQFGVLLDDATLRQEAMRQGLIQTTTQALTPQQKVLAAYQVILKQTKDAQGDFARTSGGLANQQRELTAAWGDMQAELGSKLLPAATATVKVFNNGVIPAVEGAGGVVSAAAHAFGDLPGPVKASAAAFIALRIASATGVTSALASGATAAGSAMTGLRIRTLLAADAFSAQRASAGRLSASLAAVRAASAGAGGGLTRGLKGATALVGGPWGAALLGGTAILAHFWGEHQKAKARVEEFTEAIKADSGALKGNTREAVANRLEKDGILKDAQKLGISLETVTNAALGNKDAMASLQATLQGYKDAASNAAESGAVNGQEMQANVIDAQALIGKIQGTSGALADSRAEYKRHAEAVGDTATATGKATTATESYATQLDKAKDAIRGLLDQENKRRNAQLTIRQDRLALVEQLQAAREEAGKGKRTLDENTKAGQENQQALFDLASQWNNSAESVKNAKGAYHDLRKNFIDIAVSMGDSKTEARKLADSILNVPRRVDTHVHTPGMKGALRDLAELRAQLAAIHNFKGERFVFSVQASKNQAALSEIHRAGGGPIYGPGSGTSDSILMWGSNGEFMQRKAAVDYYGLDYMRRLNNLQVPKFAGGGPVGGGSGGGAPASVLGHEIRGTLAIDRDGIAYIRGVVRSEIDAANRAGRGASDRNRRSGLRP
jgi:hypothetical protein